MKTITFDEYLNTDEVYVLIDLDSCPIPVMQDYVRHNDNVHSGKPLCSRCEGTGNEFMYRYRKCSACDGSGIAPTCRSILTNEQN
jgi:hypothetical protein